MARKNGKTPVVAPVSEQTPVDDVLVRGSFETINTDPDDGPVSEEVENLAKELDALKTPVVATNAQDWVKNYEPPTTHNDTEVTSIQWSCIKPGLDDLGVAGLKEVIEYCSNRIDELQKEEVEELESQMRALQDKLLALKGFRNKVVKSGVKTEKTEGSKRTTTPLVNPEDPSQVYTFGKIPDWAVKLMAKTGKTVRELREEVKASV